MAASYSKDDSFENGKKTNKDSGSRHALEKALKWGIARAAMYGDDEIFKDGMFNLNRETVKDGARIIDLDNIADILEEIKNKKTKKGSEFLLVNDKRAFYMFDTLSKELQKTQNRSLNNFYILMADEFLSLLKGEKIEFKNHKLEVKIL